MRAFVRFLTAIRLSYFDSLCITMFVIALRQGAYWFAAFWMFLGPLFSIILTELVADRRPKKDGP